MVKFIPLTAKTEHIDLKRGGVVTYETDVVHDGPALILSNNPNGEYGLIVLNQVHEGGPVRVQFRPVGQAPVKKYGVSDVVGLLAVFGQE